MTSKHSASYLTDAVAVEHNDKYSETAREQFQRFVCIPGNHRATSIKVAALSEDMIQLVAPSSSPIPIPTNRTAGLVPGILLSLSFTQGMPKMISDTLAGAQLSYETAKQLGEALIDLATEEAAENRLKAVKTTPSHLIDCRPTEI